MRYTVPPCEGRNTFRSELEMQIIPSFSQNRKRPRTNRFRQFTEEGSDSSQRLNGGVKVLGVIVPPSCDGLYVEILDDILGETRHSQVHRGGIEIRVVI